jgi:hypothetical protein
MTVSSSERKIRARLPLTRFLQAYLPLPVARCLIEQGLARVRLRAELARETVSANGVSCEWIMPQGSPKDKGRMFNTSYAAHHDPRDPLISPVFHQPRSE